MCTVEFIILGMQTKTKISFRFTWLWGLLLKQKTRRHRLQDLTQEKPGPIQVRVRNEPGYASEVAVSEEIKHGMAICCSNSTFGYIPQNAQTFVIGYAYLHIFLQRKFIHSNQRLKEQGYQQMDAWEQMCMHMIQCYSALEVYTTKEGTWMDCVKCLICSCLKKSIYLEDSAEWVRDYKVLILIVENGRLLRESCNYFKLSLVPLNSSCSSVSDLTSFEYQINTLSRYWVRRTPVSTNTNAKYIIP